MRILIIRSRNPYFESSASGNRYACILDGLMKHGVKITLVVTGGYNNIREYKMNGKHTEDDRIAVKYIIPTFNHNIWLRRLNVYVFSGLFQRIINFRLKSYLKSEYDFVWLTFERTILNTFCINSHLLKGKTILELNEYNALHNQQIGNKLQFKDAQYENQIFLKALKKIDLLVVMTKTLIEYYKTLSTSDTKFLHLPMTVDLMRFSKALKTAAPFEKPYIAFTGTFNNQKDGVDILIRSFAKIAAMHPAYKLYLAGFYYYDVPMQKKLIEEYNLADRIIYIGAIDKDKIPAFIQNAELLVMARPDSRQAQGGFPTKLGEYLATGNPVCITRVGELPDYLEDNESAFFAEPGNVDSFSEALNRALSNKQNAKRIGLNGFRVAEEHFSIDVQAKRLIEFLNSNLL